jgi:outer membrane protein assembly factor BamB
MRALLTLALAAAAAAWCDDWPEWRGKGRRGEFRETILETFPAQGLAVSWRAAIHGGYSGPVVAAGRVFVTDYHQGLERALCFAERTGRLLWSRAWPADYRGMDYASGPRASPTVDGDRVFVVGARGMLFCLNARNGAVIWRKSYEAHYNAVVPAWGIASAPLVVDERVIAVAAGRPVAKVVAWDRRTGLELWRSLQSENSEPGYSQPILMRDQGREMVIVWHARAVAALDPVTGRLLWEHPFPIHMNTPIATPVEDGPRLLVSAFFNGARMLNKSDGSVEGYQEISRVRVIRPTSTPGARRELGAVVWSHPAFANGHMIARNDEEMVRVRLVR